MVSVVLRTEPRPLVCELSEARRQQVSSSASDVVILDCRGEVSALR